MGHVNYACLRVWRVTCGIGTGSPAPNPAPICLLPSLRPSPGTPPTISCYLRSMNVAFILFNGLTVQDFVGIYEPLTRLRSMNLLPECRWRICGWTDVVSDDRGLRLLVDEVRPSLKQFNMIIVPGGIGTRALMNEPEFLEWLRSTSLTALKVSVCTGSLLLGAAGFLTGKRATTHPGAVEELAPLCGEVTLDRIVDEGDVITAGGVTAGIDLGLHLVERVAGPEARHCVARQIDYPYAWHGKPSVGSGQAAAHAALQGP